MSQLPHLFAQGDFASLKLYMFTFFKKLTPPILAALISLSGGVYATAQDLAVRYKMPDAWVGEAFFKKNGNFNICIASLIYSNGTILLVSMGGNKNWEVGIFNNRWSKRPGNLNVEAKFDRSPWFRAVAYRNDGQIRFQMSKDPEFINLFRTANYMYFRAAGIYEKLQLKGTYKLLPALTDCVNQYKAKRFVDGSPRGKSRDSSVTGGSEVQKETSRERRKKTKKKDAGGSGTGITISMAGHIITNNHVVKSCDRITVKRANSESSAAQLIKSDSTNDLALLKIDGKIEKDRIAVFADAPAVKLGEEVAVFGYPLHGLLTTSGNFVTGNVASLAGLRDDTRYYQISAPVQPGNSGGPLLDTTGKLVGVVTARINDFAVAAATGALPQNINFAVKATIVKNFLDANAISYLASPKGTTLSSVDLAEKARKVSVLVECR